MKGNPTAEQLATIAVQFLTAGDDQAEALRKANALYFAARDYLEQFAAISADDKAFDLDPEKATYDLADRTDLWLGDSETNSPALKHFRAIAKTKLEGNISHQAFISLIEREYGQRTTTLRLYEEAVKTYAAVLKLAPNDPRQHG